MFKSIRINNPIYILTKSYNPMLETGIVSSVSQPRMGQGNPNNPYMPAPMVVDIVATFGNDRRNLNGLPAEQSIFDYQQGGMVVTEDKSLIVNEIKSLYQQEEAKVNGYDHSKELMGIYSNMLNQLDPEAMERKRNADRMTYLENALAQQTKINEQILAQLQSLSGNTSGGDSDSTRTTKKTKENA